MSLCIMFGGAGFVGTKLAESFIKEKRFTKVILADIKSSPLDGKNGIAVHVCDVRKPIDLGNLAESPDWIFNFAAIHREPGHQGSEYFETNIRGAHNVCAFSESVGCNNIFFTSSISVYGPCLEPTDESKLPSPITPYGGSKYPAELIHQVWLNSRQGRRLIITRPGVIYGPGDPGNILRMIRAIKKGYFAFPGSSKIHKSYAYIYGFIESINFMMNRNEKLLIYNYVESPTETIEQLAAIVKRKMNSKAPVVSLPPAILMPVARILQALAKDRNPIHPVRVKKAGTPTHIVPGVLKELGFTFRYDFEKSLDHWLSVSPEDFV
jgi:nucleoside-diphosphate-sugar epimerase